MSAAIERAEASLDGGFYPPLRGSSLYLNVSWTLAGNVVYAASQWLLLVTLAKMGRPEQVGQLALGLAITGPLFIASQFHLRAVQATDARGEFTFSEYLGLRSIGTVAAALFTVGLTVGLGYEAGLALVVIFVGLGRSFDNFSDIYYGALQQQERMARMGKSMMLKGALSVSALALAMALTRNVVSVAVALMTVSALTFLLYDRRSVAFGCPSRVGVMVERFRWNPAGCWLLLKTAFPLTIVMVLVSLNLNVPRYFVERYRGAYDLGVFAALSYLIVAGNLVVNAFGQAISPKLARLYASGPRRGFWRIVFILLAIAGACGLIGMAVVALAGERLVGFVYNASYTPYASLLTGMMVAASLLYAGQFLGYAMTAARIFRPQAPLFLLAAGATTAACSVLIPRDGLRGAVTAMSVGFAVQVVGGAAILFRDWLRHKA